MIGAESSRAMRFVGFLLVTACQTTTPVTIAPVAFGSASQTTSPRPPRTIAEDSNRTRTQTVDERCADAFNTFRTRIHAGDSAAAVRAVLGAPTWIGSDMPVDVLGGLVPVEMTMTDQTVVFMCLPKLDARVGRPWSPWTIYARLEGRDSKTFGAFLASGGRKTLIEYALCHVETDGQQMKIEKFR